MKQRCETLTQLTQASLLVVDFGRGILDKSQDTLDSSSNFFSKSSTRLQSFMATLSLLIKALSSVLCLE